MCLEGAVGKAYESFLIDWYSILLIWADETEQKGQMYKTAQTVL